MRRPVLFAAAALLVICSAGEPFAFARPAHRTLVRQARHAAMVALLAPSAQLGVPAGAPKDPKESTRSTRTSSADPLAVQVAEAVVPVPVAGGGTWAFWGPRIRGCESGNGPNGSPDYRALNRHTGASGAYQFLDGTWHGRYGVSKARDAVPEQQEIAAYELYLDRGTQPWRSAQRCWRATPPADDATSGPLTPPGSAPQSTGGTAGAPPPPASGQPAAAKPAPPPKAPKKDEKGDQKTPPKDDKKQGVGGLLGGH